MDENIKNEFYIFDTIRHNKAKPPKEAYLYFPKGEHIVVFNQSNPNKTLRRIFEGNIEYLPFEKDALIRFHNFLSEKVNKDNSPLVFPTYWKDFNTLRMLQASGYDFPKTYEILKSNINFRETHIPVSVSDKIIEILNSGFLYGHGRDYKFRPIIVIRVAIYNDLKSNYDYSDWENSIVYFMEYMIKNCLISGQLENWNVICDLDGTSVIFLPSAVKNLLSMLSSNYRCRLFTMFILNLTAFLRTIWGLVSGSLDPVTQQKIKIVQPGDAELFKLINRNQLEKKYGGFAENVVSHFFPLILPSDSFNANDNSIGNELMNEDDYKILVKNDEKIVRSPYIDYTEEEILFVEEDKCIEDNIQNELKSIKNENFNESNGLVIESEGSKDFKHKIKSLSQYKKPVLIIK